MRKFVVPIAVFVLFVAAALAGFNIATAAQDDAATIERDVTNETISQQVGIYQLVDAAEGEFFVRANDSVTVYNSSDVELTEGTDYEWNASDGTILFKATASTTDGANANITYAYDENTGEVQQLAGPVGAVVEAVGRLPIMAAGLGFALLFIAIAVFVGRRLTGGKMQTNR